MNNLGRWVRGASKTATPLRPLLISPLFLLVAAHGLRAQVNVLTADYDTYRTNANLSETILTTANVNPKQFGKVTSFPVDGQILAQPLYVSGVNIPGRGDFNVVYVATLHNSVYAFNADAAADRNPLWRASVGPPVPAINYSTGTDAYSDISPEVGILSTPVIDLSDGTLFAVAATFDGTTYSYSLHALNIATGLERAGSPVAIQASVPGYAGVNGIVAFSPYDHLQRPGLLLLNGTLYIGFGSHGDDGAYHGWILAYAARDLSQTAVLNVTPDGAGGSIWQAGRGIAADDAGNLYAVAANGVFDGTNNLSQTVLALNPALSVLGWFLPSDWQNLNAQDFDLGSCGPILVPGSNYLVTGGKDGSVFLLDRTRLPGSTYEAALLQRFPAVGSGVFTMALWNSAAGPLVYVKGWSEGVKSYRLGDGRFNTSPDSQSGLASYLPYQGLAISANGSQAGSGILWMTSALGGGVFNPGTLHAFDASDLSKELWNSGMNAPADSMGNFSKFVAPTVANGRVFVPTASNQMVVYGLKAEQTGGDTPAAIAVANAASYAGDTVAPGEFVSIFGTAIGPPAPVSFAPDPFGNVPSGLAGTLVFFDDVAAPVTYTSAGQVNAIVPDSVTAGANTRIQVQYLGVASQVQTLPVSPVHPALFGAILNQDMTLNSTENPAAAGSIVVLFGTGVGLSGSPSAALVANAPLPQSKFPVSVTIAGQPADVLYAGGSPGLVGAALQINARVPAGIAPGPSVPVALAADGIPGPPVTLAVK